MKTFFETKEGFGGNYKADLADMFIPRAWFAQGGLWVWGSNDFGILGDNTIVSKSSPVQTVSGGTNWKLVASGNYHTAAIKTDGTLWSWGAGTSGELGNNAITSRSSPVQTISGGTDWKQVAAGGSFTAAIKTNGTLWLWGYGYQGRLGNNSTLSRSSPVQTVAGGNNWKQVSCGRDHAGAVKTNGTLWLWGANGYYGQLGDNTTINKSSPVQTVSGGTNWKQVSCAMLHTAAIKTDGTLWLWGAGDSGQLGDNAITRKSSPVQTVAGGTNWKQVSIWYYTSTAIKTDGTLWCWGSGGNGNHGDNTRTNKSSPVQTISGGTNWKQVSCGENNVAAIKTDGTLWGWGKGFPGALGDNTTVSKSSPVQTVAGGTNWKEVESGRDTVHAVKDDF
jgi:alpha-tubulin suppressor-like RCC1 family protein